jgi:hypothetical protein
MNKIILTLLFTYFALTTFAQVKVGLRIAPGIGLTRIEDKIPTDYSNLSRGNNSVSITIGPDIDFFMNDNIAFCTGLWWTSRKVSYHTEGLFVEYAYTSSLQYIQLPLTFKAYTNDITNGMKFYAQLGGLLDVKISDKLKSSSPDLSAVPGYKYEKWYQYVNVGIYAGTGVEFAVNDNNAFYTGIFYQRGLINQARNFKNSLGGSQNNFAKQQKVMLSSIGLELGFKF